MLYIKKDSTPNELTEYKNNGNNSYESFPQKHAIRVSLLNEQTQLCAYCMQRISVEKMKIEHFKSQTSNPELQLEYSNMLGCCLGQEGKPYKQQTCDTHKGDMPLSLNPSVKSDFDKMRIMYSDDGAIISLDEKFDNEINTVLNLNTNLLKNNRRVMIEAAKQALNFKSGIRTKSEIEKLIDKFKSQHKPFYGAAVYYLEKKLKSAR